MSGEPYKQTRDDLQRELEDQLRLLERSAEAFDQGDVAEAKRMAAIIRLLMHDKGTNRSLLAQLGLKDQLFCNTARIDPRKDPQMNRGGPELPRDGTIEEGRTYTQYGAYFGLVVASPDGQHGAAFYAPLDRAFSSRSVPFDEWWDGPVFSTDTEPTLCRSSLILSMAEQDGGAHVDPKLNAAYAKIARRNGLNLLVGVFPGSELPKTIPAGSLSHPKYAAEASVRQIAHEVLKALRPGYAKHPPAGQYDFGFGGGSVALKIRSIPRGEAQSSRPVMEASSLSSRLIRRNRPCSCGSGRPYKKCCGKRPKR